MAELFDRIGWVSRILGLVAYLVIVVAIGSILASIYNTMNERRREFAILRALGARRTTVFGVIVLEAMTIALLGIAAGFLVYSGILAAALVTIREQTGVVIAPFHGDAALWLVPLGMLAAGALAGLAPAFKAYRTDVPRHCLRCRSAAAAVCLFAAGACSTPAPVTQDPRAPSAASADVHQHHAPRGGMLIELGDELGHVEIVFDREAGALTVYVLDGEADAPRRLAQPTLPIVLDAPPALAGRPLELHAVASALTGERVGDTSEFTWRDPRLKDLTSISGQILAIDVGGQTFREIRFPPVRTGTNPDP